MLQHAVNGAKWIVGGATLVAVATPGFDFLAEALENAFEANEAVHNFFENIGDILENAGEIFAKIGNAIGVNHLAGVENLTGESFTEGFGVIPDVMGNLAQQTPKVWNAVVENPGTALAGGALAVGLTSLDPKFASAVNDTERGFAKNVVNIANKAANTVQTAASKAVVGKETAKLAQKSNSSSLSFSPSI